MQTVIPEVTTEVLQAFADAWNRHDVDALMSFMTEDCVFESSAGADVCGTRYVGMEAVRAGFAEVWTTFPDAHWGNARHFVVGELLTAEIAVHAAHAATTTQPKPPRWRNRPWHSLHKVDRKSVV